MRYHLLTCVEPLYRSVTPAMKDTSKSTRVRSFKDFRRTFTSIAIITLPKKLVYIYCMVGIH